MPLSPIHSWETPEGSEQPQVHLDFESLAAAIDADVPVVCTSTTRPAGKLGRRIYESDTGKILFYSSAGQWTYVQTTETFDAWTGPGGGAVAGGFALAGNLTFPAWPCDSRLVVDTSGYTGYIGVAATIGWQITVPALTGGLTFAGPATTAPVNPVAINTYGQGSTKGMLFIPAGVAVAGFGFAAAHSAGNAYYFVSRETRRIPVGSY